VSLFEFLEAERQLMAARLDAIDAERNRRSAISTSTSPSARSRVAGGNRRSLLRWPIRRARATRSAS